MNKIFFLEDVNPHQVFGSVGRCGSGPGTLWKDWSIKGEAARESINNQYVEALNQLNGFYEKLKESVLKEGIKNPIIVTHGVPYNRSRQYFPDNIWCKILAGDLYVAEGVTGGSRLWAAQETNTPISLIVNSRELIKGGTEIRDQTTLKSLYHNDVNVFIDRGIAKEQAGSMAQHHMGCGADNTNNDFVIARTRIWINLLKKHGYVARVHPQLKLLMEK